jgi:hypothetical protein
MHPEFSKVRLLTDTMHLCNKVIFYLRTFAGKGYEWTKVDYSFRQYLQIFWEI